jgi:hypothetical protein
MTTTTELTDLTNGSVVNGEWAGTGVFDMLIAAVNKNIEIQYQKGRITGSDYADVYLGGVQAVLQQSVQWVLQVDTSDAQVDDIRKGIELKEAQLVGLGIDNQLKALQEQLVTVEVAAKQYEKDVLLVDQHDKSVADINNAERQLVQAELTAAAQRSDIAKGIEVKQQQIVEMTDNLLTSSRQRELLTADLQTKQYQLTSILPANLAQLQKETEVTERKMQEEELTGVRQREVLVADKQVKEQQVASAVDALVTSALQRDDITKGMKVKDAQISNMTDELLTAAKQREVLEVERQSKAYEVTNILPANLDQIKKQTDVTERKMVEDEATGNAQRAVLEKDKEAKAQQILNAQDELLTAAKQRTLLDTQEEAEQYRTTYILPKELSKLEKEIDVTERNMTVEEKKLADELLTSAKQREALAGDVEIKAETRKLTYAERVIKDKEAANLGLDMVVKTANTTPEAVYTPKYEEVVV